METSDDEVREEIVRRRGRKEENMYVRGIESPRECWGVVSSEAKCTKENNRCSLTN